MPDRSTFLATIQANPGEDAPILVFADWLEEQGETGEAELIRVHCELRRTPECLNGRTPPYVTRSNPRWEALQERRTALCKLMRIAGLGLCTTSDEDIHALSQHSPQLAVAAIDLKWARLLHEIETSQKLTSAGTSNEIEAQRLNALILRGFDDAQATERAERKTDLAKTEIELICISQEKKGQRWSSSQVTLIGRSNGSDFGPGRQFRQP